MLAYLAITRRPHTRDKLAALLWGEMSDADAKNNLRQVLTNLRKFADDCLTITRDSIEFSGDSFIDSAQFEMDLRSAASLAPEPASVIVTDSLRLYRGDFLEGFHVREAPEFEDWMLAERARLRELALGALHLLTQFHTRQSNFSEAITFASRLLTFDPWREEAHRHLMLLQARTGQLSAALAQYETCRKLLEKELGVEPSLETTALYERIRSARRSHRHNIPASSTEFIGREAELSKLRQRLADPACRLIYFEAQALFQLALDALQAPADAESLPMDERGILIARLMMSRSRTMGNLGRVDEADAVLKSCLRFFRRAEKPADVAVCLNHLGYSAHFTERYEETKKYYDEELEIARRLGDKSEIANALNNLAVTARAMNQIEAAISLQVECLALRRELQDHAGISTSLFNLGSALSILHDYEQAKRYLEEAIEITRQLNHTRVLAAALGNLGGILTEEGRHEEALGLYQQGLEIHRETGFRLGIALALDNVGTAYYFLENELESQYYLRQSIREARELHADYIALDALVSIAGLRARKGDAEKALEFLSLVRTHPKADVESVHAAEKLLPQVVAGLGADAIRAAEERGRMLELDQAINDVLR